VTDSIIEGSEEADAPEIDFEGLDSPDTSPGGEEPGENDNDLTDFLKSKSPHKNLEEYQGHTLDFDGNESTRRLIRGIEGLVGEANYAVADIIIGFAQKITDLGAAEAQDGELDGLSDMP